MNINIVIRHAILASSIGLAQALFAQTATLQIVVQNAQHASSMDENAISPASGSHNYAVGTDVPLSAIPKTGYTYHWECDDPDSGIDGLTGPVTLRMTKDYTVTLVFEAALYSLAVTTPVTGGSAAILAPVPADPSRIPYGSVVSVEAVADTASGYRFVRWQTDPEDVALSPNGITAKVSVYMSKDAALTPVFEKDQTNLLAIDVNPAGSGGSVSPGGYATIGSSRAITATPHAGYEFDQWIVNEGSVTIADASSNNTTATLGAPTAAGTWRITALFKTAEPPAATLTIFCQNGGSVEASQPGSSITTTVAGGGSEVINSTKGTSIQIKAKSDNENLYSFAGWDGPVNNPSHVQTSVLVNGAMTVTAKFVPKEYNFTVQALPAEGSPDIGLSKLEAVGSGTSGVLTATISGTGTSRQPFLPGHGFALTATPDAGYYFKSWSATGYAGLPAGTPSRSPVQFSGTMPASPVYMTAYFQKDPEQYVLTLTKTPGGSASATGTYVDPVDGAETVNIIADGFGSYQADTTVTLTATPAAGYAFLQWTGDDVASPLNAITTVTMNAAKNVTATFKRTHADVTVNILPAAAQAAGAKVIRNAWPDEDLIGVSSHELGTTLPLKAVDGLGGVDAWVFDHWEGDASGSGNTTSVAINADKTVTAVFVQRHVLTLNFSTGSGGNNFTVSPGSLSSDAGGTVWTGYFVAGTVVTIAAIPNDNLAFVNWSGDTTGASADDVLNNPLSITMDRSRAITANISAKRYVKLQAVRTQDSQTPMDLSGANGAGIQVRANISHSGRIYSHMRPFVSVSDTSVTNQGNIASNAVVQLNASQNVVDSTSGVVWQFSSWSLGWANDGDKASAPYNVITTSPTGSYVIPASEDVGILAIYTDQRQLGTTVKLDGAETTAIQVKVDSELKTTGQTKSVTYNVPALLDAATTSDYIFSGWNSVDGGSVATATATVTLTSDKTVTANFKTKCNLQVGISTVPAGSEGAFSVEGVITATNGTTASPIALSAANPSTAVAGKNDQVILEADLNTTVGGVRYQFAGWDVGGDGSVDSEANTYTFNISSDTIINAVYIRQYAVTFQVGSGPGTGSTTYAGTHYFNYNSMVSFGANHAAGSEFDYWESSPPVTFGNGTTSPYNFIENITTDCTLTAYFKLSQNALTAGILVDDVAPTAPAVVNLLTITADGTVLKNAESKGYYYNELATVQAAEPSLSSGFRFKEWVCSAEGFAPAGASATLNVLGNQTVTASYESIHTLTLEQETRPPLAGTGGSVSATGQIEQSGNIYSYAYNTTATLTATPNPGFEFIGWSIDGSAILVMDDTLAMTANRTAKAVFAKQYTLTMAVDPSGVATTNPAATGTFYHGQEASISTTSINSGYSFSHWTSSNAGSTFADASLYSTKITIMGDTTATARYIAGSATLKADVSVDGVVMPATFTDLSITANGTQLYSTQTKVYSYNDTATLAATPGDSTHKFIGWSSNVTAGVPASDGTIAIASTGTTTVIAYYKTLHAVTVETEAIPSGTGGSATVTDSNYESVAGNVYTYTHGSNATLNATALPGYRFIRWEIYAGGSITPTETHATAAVTLTVNDSVRAKAVFAQEYTIVFATNPTIGAGTILPAATTTRTSYYGETIILTATPNTGLGWSFVGWTATGSSIFDDAASVTATLTVRSDETITGNFSLAGTERNLTINIKVDGALVAVAHPLTVSADGSTVPGNATATALHSTESKPYYPIDTAALDASVISGLAGDYAFFAWEDLSGGAATTPTRNVAMSAGSRTLTALYKSRITLIMATNPLGVGITSPSVGPHNDVLRGDSVSITADLSAAQLDSYVFRNWSVDSGSDAVSPGASMTSVVMDPVGAAKTVTANFDPGYRLDVLVKYETSPAPNTSPLTYAEVAGSRTSLASGAGNTAGVVNVPINAYNHSVETIVQGGTVTVRAVAAAGYEFKGWELDGTIIDTSVEYTHTMTAPATLKAVFDKIRVTLEVYTNPSNNPNFVGECSNGLLAGAANAEPKVYQFFWGATASLHAENHDTAHYNFAGWRSGIGMGTLISGSLDCTYGPLTQSVTRVTALFLPKDGDYLLYIYTEPDAQSRPDPLTHPIITAVSAAGYSCTYTIDEAGRPVCIAAVPSGTINILAAASSGGWGFHHWEPISGCSVSNFGNRNDNSTTFSHTVAQGLDPLPVVKILAVYANVPGYRLSLQAVFDEPEAVPGYLIGRIAGNSTDSSNWPWLYVAGARLFDTQILDAGNRETFAPDSAFLGSSLSIAGWDYDVGGVRIVTGATGNSFVTNPGTAGISELVTVHIVLDWKTVSLHPSLFEQPTGPGWTTPAGFAPTGNFTNVVGNAYDANFLPRLISPPPSPYVWQGQRVRNASAPTLSVVNSDSANYRFKHWTTSIGTSTTQLLGWETAWPQTLAEDRHATATFVRLMPVELAIRIDHTGGGTNQDKAIVRIPAGDPNNHGIEVSLSRIEPDPPVQKYDYMRQITVEATPQASEYHVVKEFIIEQDRNNDGIYEWSNVIPGNNTTAPRIHSFALDYPTKVTVVFDGQQSTLNVEVAEGSPDNGKHGKIMLNGLPAAGALSASGTFSYFTTQSVQAIPDDGYFFKGWTVASATVAANAAPSTSASATVLVDFDKTIFAHFGRKVTLTMATNLGALFGATITPNAGTYSELPAGIQLTDGSQVDIQASPDAGWDFVRWEIVDDDNLPATPRIVTTPTTTLTLKGDTTATAIYAKLFDVTIAATPAPTLATDSNKVTATPAPKSGGTLTANSNSGNGEATGEYREDTDVTFTAAPSAHYQFDHWEITVSGTAEPAPYPTAPSIIRKITGPTTAKAVFTPKNYTITVKPYSVSTLAPIANTLDGVTTAAVTPATHNFLPPPQSTGSDTWTLPYGSTVTLSTTAANHYVFEKWTNATGLIQHGTNPDDYTFPVLGDQTIRAQFKRSEYFLTTALDPAATAGSIISSPVRLGNPSTHSADSTVTLTATGPDSVDFDGWSGDIGSATTTNPVLPLAMTQDRTVTARFVDVVRLAVDVSDPAFGSVTVDGARRAEVVGGVTYYVFEAGAIATITAIPSNAAFYQFDNWDFSPSLPAGITAAQLSDSPLSFTMPSTPGDILAVTANFSARAYTLTVEARAVSSQPVPYAGAEFVQTLDGSGAFTGSPQNFLVIPSASVKYNTAVQLSTSAKHYYRFVRWTNGTLTPEYGTNITHTYTMPGADQTVVALFERSHFRLTARVDPAGGGSIIATPAGTADPLSAADTTVYAAVAPATVVALAATDASGKIFTGWTGPGTSGASINGRNISLTMNTDREVTANFANAYLVTIPATLHGTVTVSGQSPYATVTTNPDGSKVYVFVEGSTATITATPESLHYYVDRWDFSPSVPFGVSPDPAGNPVPESIIFTVTQDVTVQPNFQARIYTLTVTASPAAAAQRLEAYSPVHDFIAVPSLSRYYPAVVALEAEPADAAGNHYRFDSWKEGSAILGTGTTHGFTFDRNANITANFVRQALITINPPEDRTPGHSPMSPCGAVTPGAGEFRYDVKTVPDTITITATAETGFEFAGWLGNVPASAALSQTTTDTTSVATLTLTIDDALAAADIVLTPTFKRRLYTVKVARWERSSGVGSGGYIPPPTPAPEAVVATQGSTYTYQYYYGTQVTALVNSVFSGYRFIGWGSSDNEPASLVVAQAASGTFPDAFVHTVTGDCFITALFTRVHLLDLSASPASKGSATVVSPAGRPVGGYPNKTEFDHGTDVYIQAAPVAGSDFMGWIGAVLDPDAAATSINLTQDQNVIARFGEIIKRNLNITVSPANTGTVAINGSSPAYTTTGTQVVTPDGEYVQLTATPIPGYKFDKWTPGSALVMPDQTMLATSVHMDANKSVTANFVERKYSLQVFALPTAAGTVTGGGGNFAHGALAAIKAVATDSNYEFVRWDIQGLVLEPGDSLVDLTSPNIEIPMRDDKIAYAVFRHKTHSGEITVKIFSSETGSLVECPTAAIKHISSVDADGIVTITITPVAGYSFESWDGDLFDYTGMDTPSGVHTAKTYANEDKVINVTLGKQLIVLDWAALPTDAGSVTLPPGGSPAADINGTAHRYIAGFTGQVAATGSTNWRLKSWSGNVSYTPNTDGSVPPIGSITLSANATVLATFEQKPSVWRVSVGFNSTQWRDPAGGDKLSVTGTMVISSTSNFSPVAIADFEDKQTCYISCVVNNTTDYYFEGWTNLPSGAAAKVDETQHKLYVTESLSPLAIIKTKNAMLYVRITCEGDNDPGRSPAVSIGGEIEGGGVVEINQIYTVRVTLNSADGYTLDDNDWTPFDIHAHSAYVGSIRKGYDPDTNALLWVERDVRVADMETMVEVNLRIGGASPRERRDELRGSKHLHDDVTKHKSSGNFINKQ